MSMCSIFRVNICRGRRQKHLYSEKDETTKTDDGRHVDTSVNRQPPKPQSVGLQRIFTTHPSSIQREEQQYFDFVCFFLLICFERCESQESEV